MKVDVDLVDQLAGDSAIPMAAMMVDGLESSQVEMLVGKKVAKKDAYSVGCLETNLE